MKSLLKYAVNGSSLTGIRRPTSNRVDLCHHSPKFRPACSTSSLVARTVATRFIHRPRPIRLCYSGEVFRYDEPTERAAREFHQVGLEHIGQAGAAADLEILLIAVEALTALGLSDFR